MARAMPRPAPSVRFTAALASGSKRRRSTCLDRPGPVSVTVKRTMRSVSSSTACALTAPPSGVKRMAFSARFHSACVTRRPSQCASAVHSAPRSSSTFCCAASGDSSSTSSSVSRSTAMGCAVMESRPTARVPLLSRSLSTFVACVRPRRMRSR